MTFPIHTGVWKFCVKCSVGLCCCESTLEFIKIKYSYYVTLFKNRSCSAGTGVFPILVSLTALKGSAITSVFKACLLEGNDVDDECEASVAHALHTQPVNRSGHGLSVCRYGCCLCI